MSLLLLAAVLAAAPGEIETTAWQRSVALLEYVAADSPRAIAQGDQVELKEQEALLQEVSLVLGELTPAPQAQLDQVNALIGLLAHRDPSFPERASALASTLAKDHDVFRIPRVTVDLERAASVYSAQCASCHGATGWGDGPAGRALQPPPASFHDAARMDAMSPKRVYSTATFGIPGTAMVGFPNLSVEIRWMLAFYVMTLRQPPCTGSRTVQSIEVLAQKTDAELRSGGGDLACLRREFPTDAIQGNIAAASQRIGEVLTNFRAGDARKARQGVIEAYLENIEPIEPTLKARDAKLTQSLEQAFVRLRAATQGQGDVAAEAAALQLLLEQSEKTDTSASTWTTFLAALVIILREGMEAVLVIGALLAVLRKMGAQTQQRLVHAGWIAALLLGATVTIFGQALFRGANREWMESTVALAAVGLLIYTAVWLNRRSRISSYVAGLKLQVGAAIAGGSSATLFTIAFFSAGRESIETALFLQGLGAQDWRPVAWGALLGLALLFAAIGVVLRIGISLPLPKIFKVSTALLLATAVMLLGRGLHGLQELGVLSYFPSPGITVAPLGIFPDAMTLGAQACLAILCWVGIRRASKNAPLKRVLSAP